MDRQKYLFVITFFVLAGYKAIDANQATSEVAITEDHTKENMQYTTEPSQNESTTAMWFGTGRMCLFRIRVVYKLNISQTDMFCICTGKCVETSEELGKVIRKENVEAKRANQKEHVVAKSVLYILVFVTGLFGNLLVIVTVSRFMGRMTVTNIYILNLAVADLLVILICVPIKAYESIYMLWELGLHACRVIAWLYFGCFMCSAFTLMCMALERYMVINHPMRSQMVSSIKRTMIIIICIWIFGILMSLPAFFFGDDGSGTCAIAPYESKKKLGFYLYVFIAICLVPSTLMAFAYIRTSITLWKSIKKQQQMKQTSSEGKNDKHTDTSGRAQVIRVLIGVLVVFIICWVPYLGMQVYLSTDHILNHFHLRDTLRNVSQWLNFLSLANSCLNPILYGVLSRQFRRGFLRCLTCRRKGVDTTKSYITATTSGGGMTSQHAGMKGVQKMKVPMKEVTTNSNDNNKGTVNGDAIATSDITLNSKDSGKEESIANGKVTDNVETGKMDHGQNDVKSNPV